ncbi:hypothetical protein Hsw_0895 [Hymenobacter swuensis DY53]|uniref:Uncharacterized protein n=1 Tax=Hymenobacter swuensis DY53 TaxID=1227739 RepID=W8F412_9BACT|nr:hypothetical protein Hsw_0895 [Hymenobacter swuensis DY53]
MICRGEKGLKIGFARVATPQAAEAEPARFVRWHSRMSDMGNYTKPRGRGFAAK